MKKHLNQAMCLTASGKIKQSALREFEALQTQINAKKAQLSALKKEVETLETDHEMFDGLLRSLINDGHKVSAGELVLKVMVKEIKPRLAWKELFMKWVPDGFKKAQQLMDERPTEQIPFVIIESRTHRV